MAICTAMEVYGVPLRPHILQGWAANKSASHKRARSLGIPSHTHVHGSTKNDDLLNEPS